MKQFYIDLEEFLVQRNPLAFKDDKGNVMYFKTYMEAYYEMIHRVYLSGPKYVDLVLLCVKTYGMEKNDAERFVKKWRCYGVNEDFMLLNWNIKDDGDRRMLTDSLRKIAQGLHMLVGAKFNNDMFLFACDRYFKFNIKNK